MNNEKELRHRYGWTPAPTKPMYSQTNVTLEHRGRDYDAILRAGKRKPVGYWEDAPAGIKFGGQPLPSASTKPHGKDVDTADDPWPKCLMHHDGGYEFLDVYALDAGGLQYHKNDPHAYRCSEPYSTRIGKETVEAVSQAEAAQWLEAHGHKDVAAQLRGKDATGGGRVWTGLLGNDVAAKRACVLIGGIGYCRVRGNWHYLGEQKGEPTGEKVELFGTERDAIIAECCAAMNLDPKTGEPLHA